MGIPDPVPRKVTGHDGAFHSKYLHPDDLFRHGYYPCLDDAALVDTVHPFRICIQIKYLPLFQHGFPAAGYHTARLGINSFYNEVDLYPSMLPRTLFWGSISSAYSFPDGLRLCTRLIIISVIGMTVRKSL